MELNIKDTKRKNDYVRHSSDERNCEFVCANYKFANRRCRFERRSRAFL